MDMFTQRARGTRVILALSLALTGVSAAQAQEGKYVSGRLQIQYMGRA
jgi:hypothetical protein